MKKEKVGERIKNEKIRSLIKKIKYETERQKCVAEKPCKVIIRKRKEDGRGIWIEETEV
jgi:hypothetical protein